MEPNTTSGWPQGMNEVLRAALGDSNITAAVCLQSSPCPLCGERALLNPQRGAGLSGPWTRVISPGQDSIRVPVLPETPGPVRWLSLSLKQIWATVLGKSVLCGHWSPRCSTHKSWGCCEDLHSPASVGPSSPGHTHHGHCLLMTVPSPQPGQLELPGVSPVGSVWNPFLPAHPTSQAGLSRSLSK